MSSSFSPSVLLSFPFCFCLSLPYNWYSLSIRWCFLCRKVFVLFPFVMKFCGPVFLCGVNSCEMPVDVLLTDRLPLYFPVKVAWLRFGNGCKCVWNMTHWPYQLVPLRLSCIELTWTCVWTDTAQGNMRNLVSLQVTLRLETRRAKCHYRWPCGPKQRRSKCHFRWRWRPKYVGPSVTKVTLQAETRRSKFTSGDRGWFLYVQMSLQVTVPAETRRAKCHCRWRFGPKHVSLNVIFWAETRRAKCDYSWPCRPKHIGPNVTSGDGGWNA